MHVYDFDNTIYEGDSTRDFYFYCLRKHPRILLCLPSQFFHFILYMAGYHTKTAFKEKFYSFFQKIPNIDQTVAAFWENHFSNIKKWYMDTKEPTDVVVSASPEFLLELPCKKLGIMPPIASRVDAKTGKYDGLNCYGEEKVPRFLALYKNASVKKFFSDSLSDAPLSLLADKRFIVRGTRIIPWKSYKPSFLHRFLHAFLSPQFVRFLLVGAFNTGMGVLLAFLYSTIMKDVTLSYAAGYLTTLLLSYVLNSIFTFKKRFALSHFLKFAVSYVPNFLIQCICVFLLSNLLLLPNLFSYILAAIIGIPVTYLFLKIYAFRK